MRRGSGLLPGREACCKLSQIVLRKEATAQEGNVFHKHVIIDCNASKLQTYSYLRIWSRRCDRASINYTSEQPLAPLLLLQSNLFEITYRPDRPRRSYPIPLNISEHRERGVGVTTILHESRHDTLYCRDTRRLSLHSQSVCSIVWRKRFQQTGRSNFILSCRVVSWLVDKHYFGNPIR